MKQKIEKMKAILEVKEFHSENFSFSLPEITHNLIKKIERSFFTIYKSFNQMRLESLNMNFFPYKATFLTL